MERSKLRVESAAGDGGGSLLVLVFSQLLTYQVFPPFYILSGVCKKLSVYKVLAMNEKTLRLLEFDAVRTRVAACALSGEAARLIMEAEPLRGREETARLKGLVSAVLDLMNSGTNERREDLPDLAAFLPRLETEGAVPETDEALALGIFLERGRVFKAWLAGAGGDSPLAPLLAALPDCSAPEAEIFRIIDREGRIRDLKELADIRRRIRSLTKDLENASSRYTGNEEIRRMLQSGVPSQRDGRMVLAVKANFRGRIRGIVHEVSSTGQTVFVEPEEVVEKNNELFLENRRLESEIRRILREMMGRLSAFREDLNRFYGGIVYLETIRARARYGFETRGCFAGEDPSGALILKAARHPLLGPGAVPLDFAMAPGKRTVIITGPNTGGKTVALKTAGLLALMNQSGLPLPAGEGTCLPVFDGVYADIGDEQSLSQSLSTFSAHMTNIAAILSSATNSSLLLLDELGSGTDPEEGSAIAMAVLDYCIEKGCRLITTTHHGVLKNFGYTRQGVENASVDFDSRTLSPTYRIVMGVPGESRAVDIAGRNGIPEKILRDARAYLAEERADVSALIRGLKEKHRELDEADKQRKAEELRLREERRQADLKELRLKQKELEVKAGGMGKFRELLQESRKTLENLVREVKEGELTREKTLRVKAFLMDLEAAVNTEDAALSAEEEALKAAVRQPASGNPPVLRPGVEVLCGEGRRRGRLVRQDKKGRWIVEIGSLKLSLSEKELTPLPVSPEGKKTVTIAPVDYAGAAPSARPELSLLGMRLPEALDALEKQIDAATLNGVHEFAVVHGKGDGILQRGIHDYLKKQSLVADYFFSRPELGGFGRTEVILRG
jgi:DNA mismatch repair protein MutS2